MGSSERYLYEQISVLSSSPACMEQEEEQERDRKIRLRYRDTAMLIYQAKRTGGPPYLEFNPQSEGIVHCQHGNRESFVARKKKETSSRVLSVNQQGFTSV